eukprot:scaffold73201_cov58-Attheya_sp.AAC.1
MRGQYHQAEYPSTSPSRLASPLFVASPSHLPSLLWHTIHDVCVVWVGVFQCGQCGHVRCT